MVLATVFGGSGFLGRRIVAQLRRRGIAVRVAVRHPATPRTARDGPEYARCDIRRSGDVAAALAGARIAVNAVSLYSGSEAELAAIHIHGARGVAEQAVSGGVERLVHVSGIGVDIESADPYIRCRAHGEAAVRAAFADASVIRPSVMFAADDAFLTRLAGLMLRLPVVPLFGRGETRLQPVCADDVAAAIAELCREAQPAAVYEFGGPDILTYRDLLRRIARRLGSGTAMMPIPFPLWQAAARLAALLPSPPLTAGQVALMRHDSIADPALPGLAALGIEPTSVDAVLAAIAAAGR